jgi:hypothetical protein
LQPVDRKQIEVFLSAFYRITSGDKSEEMKAKGFKFLEITLDEYFPPSLFASSSPCSISQIGVLLTNIIEAYLEATEEDEEEIATDDSQNIFGP